MSEKNDLDVLLEQWQGNPATNPQIKHRVWTRIAAEDSRTRRKLPEWLSVVVRPLSTPFGAMTFVAASVVCGILIAELRVSRQKNIRTEELAQNYIQLIDTRSQATEPEEAQ